MEVLDISAKNTDRLISFIEGLGEEQNSFRYFKSRGVEALENHIYTCLLLCDELPAGYGHLDKEDGIVWLGIVIKKKYQGQGMAVKMMKILVEKAKTLLIKNIQLSVDKNNIKALGLYNKFGFVIVSDKLEYVILSKEL